MLGAAGRVGVWREGWAGSQPRRVTPSRPLGRGEPAQRGVVDGRWGGCRAFWNKRNWLMIPGVKFSSKKGGEDTLLSDLSHIFV